MLAQRRREATVGKKSLHGSHALTASRMLLRNAALKERAMKSVKCLWQILDASQREERDFESINEPCSEALLVGRHLQGSKVLKSERRSMFTQSGTASKRTDHYLLPSTR